MLALYVVAPHYKTLLQTPVSPQLVCGKIHTTQEESWKIFALFFKNVRQRLPLPSAVRFANANALEGSPHYAHSLNDPVTILLFLLGLGIGSAAIRLILLPKAFSIVPLLSFTIRTIYSWGIG